MISAKHLEKVQKGGEDQIQIQVDELEIIQGSQGVED